ncbi:MAG: hypothetical protein GXP26_01635 [Planctomycetes bacterium]|nr:hypothetical protein [Planctomycetota bacterium]
MDQVRAIAMVVWQQRFWVLSGIGILVALVCWNQATADLEDRFAKRKSTIDSKINAVRSIAREPFHPNDNVNNGDAEQVEAQKTIVAKLWSELYEQQKTEVLSWPELPDEFAKRMENKRFRDIIAKRDTIDKDMRDKYRNYIKEQFDVLRKIVKASENATGSRRSGEFGGGLPRSPSLVGNGDLENPVVEDYLVDWLDQDNLRMRLVFNRMPSAKKIWVTQEDLWVYKTLLNVIAKTNEHHGATRPDNTAIRTIIQLQVGKDATQSNLRQEAIYIPSGTGTGGSGMPGGMPGGEGMGMGMGMERGMQGGGGPGGMEGGYGGGMSGRGGGIADAEILADRYLDPEGIPYPGESENFGAEYRKLPIRMLLTMDQRMIPEVLVECANATLPIEVTRVIVNRAKSNTQGFSGRTSSRSPMRSNSPGQGEIRRDLSEVEIQGIVLIYEPPDESVLPAAEEQPAPGGESTS